MCAEISGEASKVSGKEIAGQPVRVRIGPSPTGDPHVGTAYISLFNYAFAKRHGGQFILRIEDTDRTRSKPEWEAMLISSLSKLGLSWDEGPDVGGEFGPYRQSERGGIYAEHIAMLIGSGNAYPCFCDQERLAALRQQQRANKQTPGYDGRCRHLEKNEVESRLEAGEAHVVRLAVPRQDVSGETVVVKFIDQLRGEIEISTEQVDDQVLQKADGMPTYHLANVVDDHLMQISHVVRAEEWISSTPKHVLLYRAFGWQEPAFIHMPLLRNADKSKISKRKNPVSLNYYEQAGILPQAMLNYLGMMGWTMPDGSEKFSLSEFIKEIDFSRVSLGGPVFDIEKLTWLNGLYLREMPLDDYVSVVKNRVFNDAHFRAVAKLLQERVERLDTFVDAASFFFSGEVSYDDKALKALVPNTRKPSEIRKAFLALVEDIDGLAEMTEEAAEVMMNNHRERLGYKGKEWFMPVRVALTGRKATPGLYETMAALGKERCRGRLRQAAEILKKMK